MGGRRTIAGTPVSAEVKPFGGVMSPFGWPPPPPSSIVPFPMQVIELPDGVTVRISGDDMKL